MSSAIVFVTIALILSACALLAILGVGQLALSSVDAIERDGLARGRRAPAWTLTDSAGAVHKSPPTAPLQLIVFADHSLKSFPSVVAGLRALRGGTPGATPHAGAPDTRLFAGTPDALMSAGTPDALMSAGSAAAPLPDAARPDPADLEIVILLRGRSEIAEPVLGQLGLAGIPVLAGSPARYADYNVRVIPFAIFVDSAGRVRASSLVNHDWQLRKLWQVAAIPLQSGEGNGARSTAPTRMRSRWRRDMRSLEPTQPQSAAPHPAGRLPGMAR